MPDKTAVAERLRENAVYRTDFPQLFGQGILDDPNAAYMALTKAIAAFERTDSVRAVRFPIRPLSCAARRS